MVECMVMLKNMSLLVLNLKNNTRGIRGKMKLDIKTGEKIHYECDEPNSYYESGVNPFRNKKWVSVDSLISYVESLDVDIGLKNDIINDLRNEYG